jgi:hypothetical protein
MKNLILITAFLMVGAVTASAQTKVKQDAAGNYVSVKSDTAANKPTGHTFTDTKGISYPVYLSSTGKLFYNKTAVKSGNVYKVYLKAE